MSYHLCAKESGCVGLGRGISEYHNCAKRNYCKKSDSNLRETKQLIAKLKAKKARKNDIEETKQLIGKLKIKKVVKKIKKREKDKQVERITDFFRTAASRIDFIKGVINNVRDYQGYITDSNKPRIRKKTKEEYLFLAKREKERFPFNSPWIKKNFPNVDLNDPNLLQDLYKALDKLKKYVKDKAKRGDDRNIRTSKIRKMIDDYNKNKPKPKSKRLRVVKNYIEEYEKIYKQKLKELGVKNIKYDYTPRYRNDSKIKTNKGNSQTLLSYTINRLNLYNDGIIPDKDKRVWLKHMKKLKKMDSI